MGKRDGVEMEMCVGGIGQTLRWRIGYRGLEDESKNEGRRAKGKGDGNRDGGGIGTGMD